MKRKAKAKAKADPMVKVRRSDLQRWDYLLARAQRETIKAAPRELAPRIGYGPPAALAAYDAVEYVRDGIAEAQGGKS